MKNIVILGGGAAGMAAAVAAAEQADGQAKVILLEQNSRVGKKLLATGNGRCNLDNQTISPECYFTSDRKSMAKMLEAIEAADPLGWFEQHGLLWRADEAGRIYPYSNQASDMLNLLLHMLEKSGAEVRTDCSVASVEATANAYRITLSDGQTLSADAVICALGGSAGPQFGTNGFGSQLAERFGLEVQPLYPCLVPLKCKKSQISGLSGIRVKADAALYDGNHLIRTESGEIQFTDYGLSGIAIMQLSGMLKPNRLRRPEISLDLFPHLSEKELLTLLHRHKQAMGKVGAADFMTGLLNYKVGLAVWKSLGLGDAKRPVAELSKEEWQTLACGFKNWRFTELEDTGWKNAQTTGGGIALAQLQPESFGLKNHPGLYFVGETVDCAGSCGGYNLHWAFGSGILAGRHAASQL